LISKKGSLRLTPGVMSTGSSTIHGLSDAKPNPSADLFGSVLASVSRSFFLTIRVLPTATRRPIGLAYLLARTSDTLADSPGLSTQERLAMLRAFGEGLRDPRALPGRDALARFQERVSEPAEVKLLEEMPRLVELLGEAEAGDRADTLEVLEIIIRGQELDLLRFEGGEGTGMRALESAADLDDYAYRVAGCVGAFWTRLCHRHLRRYARLDLETMLALGVGFGKGLQLINILRDAPVDLANGRCYLPLETLRAHGIASPEVLLAEPHLARPVFAEWIATARTHLDQGRHYIEAVRPWRLRLACFLPWAIGRETLDLLEASPPLESRTRVKVSRKAVRRLFLQGLLAGWSNRPLR